MAERSPTAVLVSGGLDSAILVGEMSRQRPAVHPIYIRSGLHWEEVELAHLQKFLKAIQTVSLHPLVVLEQPVADLYGKHWSITGRDVPDADTPDEAVFLPGRNVLLLVKAMLWCHLHQVPELMLGVLGSNPFPDATPEFFAGISDVVNRAVGGSVRVLRPYAGLHKVDVLRRGQDLPLELSFSCIEPIKGQHCGGCNKCAERRKAFQDAGIADRTEYERTRPCIA
jgi:7-cyano-7-deazaguanine synthase